MSNRILIVQGGAWGSESKGSVALALAERFGVKWACRSGSINAGHTVHHGGHKKVFQQLPTPSVLPGVQVALGAGAYVHHGTLLSEVAQSGCESRLYIDRNCGVHLDSYTDEAKEAGRSLKIGATGKGCAEAVIHKIRDRGVGRPLLYSEHRPGDGPGELTDTARLLNDAYDRGDRILLEGTQGSLLDLHHGPYPYVTSRQCTSAAWVAEMGLSPTLGYEVALVLRTYPIRVAGTSGPMPREISWPVLARWMNARMNGCGLPWVVDDDALNEYDHCLRRTNVEGRYDSPAQHALLSASDALAEMSERGRTEVMKLFETTTVTKRLRRIAELDVVTTRLTVRKERPAYLVVTFLNYLFPELSPLYRDVEPHLHDEARWYLAGLQESLGCRVRFASVGPRSEDLLEVSV